MTSAFSLNLAFYRHGVCLAAMLLRPPSLVMMYVPTSECMDLHTHCCASLTMLVIIPPMMLVIVLSWQGEGSSLRAAGVGKLANLGVSVQRRWNNVLSDASRQMVVELFLGLRLPVHLPSVHSTVAPPPEPVSEGDDSDDDSPLPTPRQVDLD